MGITVNGPNGVTVNFPDGTDSETIGRVMAQATGGGKPASKPFIGSDVTEPITSGLRGINQGIATAVTAP